VKGDEKSVRRSCPLGATHQHPKNRPYAVDPYLYSIESEDLPGETRELVIERLQPHQGDKPRSASSGLVDALEQLIKGMLLPPPEHLNGSNNGSMAKDEEECRPETDVGRKAAAFARRRGEGGGRRGGG
jgi:hypothetical protein